VRLIIFISMLKSHDKNSAAFILFFPLHFQLLNQFYALSYKQLRSKCRWARLCDTKFYHNYFNGFGFASYYKKYIVWIIL